MPGSGFTSLSERLRFSGFSQVQKEALDAYKLDKAVPKTFEPGEGFVSLSLIDQDEAVLRFRQWDEKQIVDELSRLTRDLGPEKVKQERDYQLLESALSQRIRTKFQIAHLLKQPEKGKVYAERLESLIAQSDFDPTNMTVANLGLLFKRPPGFLSRIAQNTAVLMGSLVLIGLQHLIDLKRRITGGPENGGGLFF